MLRKVRNPKDLGMGLFYLVVGFTAAQIAGNYSFGSAARMGPGFFPTIVGYLAAAVGAATILRSFASHGDDVEIPTWRPIVLIVVAVAAFALLVEKFGLVIAATALLLISALASRQFRLAPPALLGLAGLVTLVSLVFVEGLGVRMSLFGTW